MKKVLFFIISLFIFIGDVDAKKIDHIDMNINIDEYGVAHVTEEWTATLYLGSEICRYYNDLGTSQVVDLTVKDSKVTYEQNLFWDSSVAKYFQYALNVSDSETEMCWGIDSYENDKYYLSYKILDFVGNMNNDVGVYIQLISKNTGLDIQSMHISIESHYPFTNKNTLFESYGYEGVSGIYDGKLVIDIVNKLDKNDYIALAIKLDSSNFKDLSLKGNYDYEWIAGEIRDGKMPSSSIEGRSGFRNYLFGLLAEYWYVVALFILFIDPYFWSLFFKPLYGGIYQYILDKKEQNRTIKKYFKNYNRDVPFDGDMLKFYYVGIKNKVIINPFNIINAYLLKWYYDGNIKIDKYYIYFIEEPKDNLEYRLYEAIGDINPRKDFVSLAALKRDLNHNYGVYYVWKQLLLRRLSLKYSNIDESDVKEVVEFRQFIERFSNMDDKDIKDIRLWEAYLLGANLLGLTDNICKDMQKHSDLDMYMIKMSNRPIRISSRKVHSLDIKHSILMKMSGNERFGLFGSVDRNKK